MSINSFFENYVENKSENSNISKNIEEKMLKNLLSVPNHPLTIIKNKIIDYFHDLYKNKSLKVYEPIDPVVSIDDNFDKLLIPKDHPSRSKTDTYYVNDKKVLATHTSAYQNMMFSNGYENFIVVGKVFRKDTVDKSHYPVFHQLEGVFKLNKEDNPVEGIKKLLSGLVEHLFPNTKYQFNDDYFPFTDPSLEIEVEFNGDLLEILGCGVVHKQILINNKISEEDNYVAFGLGLERLAMTLYQIPDIRLFWTDDPKFLTQFSPNKITKFEPYSLVDPIYRDISFYINDDVKNGEWNKLNDFMELCRDNCKDIETVNLFDKFYNKKKQVWSHSFRLIFNPTSEIKDPGEFTSEVNSTIGKLKDTIQNSNLDLVLR